MEHSIQNQNQVWGGLSRLRNSPKAAGRKPDRGKFGSSTYPLSFSCWASNVNASPPP